MFDLDTFIVECRSALSEVNPTLAVKEIVARSVADPAAMANALPQKAGVTVIVREPDLTVLGVAVPGGMPKARSIPHDHRMWAVVGVFAGQEDNVFFRKAKSSLVDSGGQSLGVTETLAMGAETVHAVHNPLAHSALGAIHVYGGDLIGVQRSMWIQPGYVEQPYDESKVIGQGGYRQRSA
jgi:predicted metal-dependent enzyme (double-stranded beta helix superfamily)